MKFSFLFFLKRLFIYPCAALQRRHKQKQWRKALDLDRHEAVFHQLFADVDGFSVSREARTLGDAMEYLYGEIDFISFIALLSLAAPNTDTVFYDLGSGIGKAVIACSMVFNVKKSCGIELFSQLHHAALHQQLRLQQLPNYHQHPIYFINHNFLQTDFTDATLIFINATAFIGETWQRLNQHLEKIAPLAVVISTTKKLTSPVFTIKRITRVQMSWGIVTAYIQQRKSKG